MQLSRQIYFRNAGTLVYFSLIDRQYLVIGRVCTRLEIFSNIDRHVKVEKEPSFHLFNCKKMEK